MSQKLPFCLSYKVLVVYCPFVFVLLQRPRAIVLQVCMMEGLFTAIEDVFPAVLRKYKKVSLGVTCLIFFIIGIPMVSYVSRLATACFVLLIS